MRIITKIALVTLILAACCVVAGLASVKHRRKSFRDDGVAVATSPIALNTSNYQYFLNENLNVQSDSDIINVSEDFYGVPWAHFLAGAPLATSWLNRLQATQQMAHKWQKPIFLSLQATSGPGRSCPADNATDGYGGMPSVTPFSGCDSCYDFNLTRNPAAASIRTAYTQYVLYMVNALQPQWLDYAINVNQYVSMCPQGFDGIVDFMNQIYAAVNANSSGVIAFPSLSMSQILQVGPGQPCQGLMQGEVPSPQVVGCIADSFAVMMNMQRDRLALSAFPHIDMLDGLNGIWPDWYVPEVLKVARDYGDGSFVISATGFPDQNIVVNQATAISGSGSNCTSMLQTTIYLASAWFWYVSTIDHAIEFVNWQYNADIITADAMSSCPCATQIPADAIYCTYLQYLRQREVTAGNPAWWGDLEGKMFGAVGMRDANGLPKQPLYMLIQLARARRSSGHYHRP